MQKLHKLMGEALLVWGKRVAQLLAVASAWCMSAAHAAYDVNIPEPATPISNQIYGLHVYILGFCAVIFVVVFAVMFYSIFKFRQSKGAKPDVNFHESTLIEIIWTVIPFVILLFMAIPATRTVLDMKDTSSPDVTVKVTGYQWGWRYDYSADDFGFYSNLSTPLAQIGQPGEPATEAKGSDYLLEVDNPIVVPVGKRVRLLVTSNDVIHGWYVPQLGVNQYGIPGFIKDAWFKADRVGTFKGQCSQICGKLHGYMPITVVVKSEADYAAWVKEGQVKWGKGAPLSAQAPKVETAKVDTPKVEAAKTEVAKVTAPAGLFPAKFLFEVGKTALPTGSEKIVATLADFMKSNATARVDLSGFTDKTGNAEKNAALAKERAKAVREALKVAGIPEDRITMKKPETITGAGTAEDARRVEINLSTSAVAATAAATTTAAVDSAETKFTLADAKVAGEKVYAANCIACHQATGKGMPPTFPALSGSKVVQGPADAQIAVLLNGKGTAMQSFARLSDSEIAAVITYTKNSWDNNTGKVIQPNEIKAARRS
jgi:cytochrome c oxidase subunit II